MSATLLACLVHANHATIGVYPDAGPRVYFRGAVVDVQIAPEGLTVDVRSPLEVHGALMNETFSSARLLGGDKELYQIAPGTAFHLFPDEDGTADLGFGDAAFTTIKQVSVACEDLQLGGPGTTRLAEGGQWMPAAEGLALAPKPGARFTTFLGFVTPADARFTEIASTGDWVEVTRTIVQGVTVTGWTKRDELAAPPPPPPAPTGGGASGLVGIGGAREAPPVKETRELPAGATVYSRDGKPWARVAAAGQYTIERHTDGRAELILPNVTGELWLDPPVSPPRR